MDATTRVHDYRQQRWGYAIPVFNSKDGGLTVSALGFGRGISANDILMLTDRTGQGLYFYRVVTLEYMLDPADMWEATLTFLPLQGKFYSVDECKAAALEAVAAQNGVSS